MSWLRSAVASSRSSAGSSAHRTTRWSCGSGRATCSPSGSRPRGEQPLFDFPIGTLTRREVAAYLVSEAIGLGHRAADAPARGPYGEGMLQQWIEVDEEVDIVAMIVGDDERLRRIAVFDAVVNNTDRKGGHLLPVPGRPPVRGGSRRDVLDRAQAPDRPLGVGGRAVRRRGARTALVATFGAALDGAAGRGSPARSPSCSSPTRSRPRERGSASCSRPASSRARTPSGPRSPGRRSDHRQARACGTICGEGGPWRTMRWRSMSGRRACARSCSTRPGTSSRWAACRSSRTSRRSRAGPSRIPRSGGPRSARRAESCGPRRELRPMDRSGRIALPASR